MIYFSNFFLKFEHRPRKYFEKRPFSQAFLAGVGVILFWRGVWEIADILKLNPALSIVIGIIMLVFIGLFIHTFVGNAIIIKNVEKEQKFEKKTEREIGAVEMEIAEEEITLGHLAHRLKEIESKIDSLNSKK